MERQNGIKQMYGHSYFARIFRLSTISLILLVSLITITFYTYVDDAVTENKYRTDMRLLEQVKHNMEINNQFVVDFCTNVYFNSSATDIMLRRENNLSLSEIIVELKKISSSVVSVSPYIHSIYIYNDKSDMYFSTYTGFGTIVNDVFLNETIQQNTPIPVLEPIPRKIRAKVLHKEVYTDVFSYFFYETQDDAGHFDGAVIINVEPTWLLKGINEFTDSSDEQIYLMSSKREFVLSDQMNIDRTVLDSVQSVYYEQIQSKIDAGIPSGMIPCELSGEKNMLSFIYISEGDFVLIKSQTFDSIYLSINRIKNTMLIITSVVLLLAVFASFIVSRKIYAPFDRLMERIEHKNPQHELPKYQRVDELGYLEDVYIRSVNEISNLKNEITSADTIKLKYYLVQLFVNSGSITDNEIAELSRSGLIRVNIRATIVLSMLKLNLQDNEEQTAKDAVVWCSEILHRQLRDRYQFDVVDLNNGSLVVIANPGQNCDVAIFTTMMENALLSLKDYALRRYNIGIDTAVGDPIHEVANISEEYSHLQKMLAYVYLYGRDIVITSSLITENINDKTLKYPEQEEKKLLREIMAQNLGMIKPALDDLIRKLHSMNYSNLIVSLVRLCTTIQSTIETIKRENFSTSLSETLEINPLEYPTLKDLQSHMYEYIHNGITEDIIGSRHKRMIEAVKEIVKTRYKDPALCLAVIADELKITPNYLNHNFKKACGMSVSEFITDFRLIQSAELIETMDASMNLIMNEVGIENESFFYKRFKEKYGTTPRNYRTARLCDQYIKVDYSDAMPIDQRECQ